MKSKASEGLNELVLIKNILPCVFESITDSANSNGRIPGLSTGIPDLDRSIMGFKNGDLIIIGSRPGMGKKSFAMSIALHVARTSRKSIAVFSSETSREQLSLNFLSSESGIDRQKLKMGKMTNEEWERLTDSATMLSTFNILINDDAALTVSKITKQCSQVRNLGLIIVQDIEYIQPVQIDLEDSCDDFCDDRNDINLAMKLMAKELDVPVICLSNISRAGEMRQNMRPILSDFRDTGAMDIYADIVLALYRDYYYDMEPENEGIAECLVLRNRRGETDRIYLQWQPEYARLSPFDSFYEE